MHSIKSVSVALASGLLAVLSSGVLAAPDWNTVPKRVVKVFHPGVTPMEWITKKGDHGGGSGLRRGESCKGCHEEEGELVFDKSRFSSKPLEPVAAPATIVFPVTVQAAYDKDNLYLRLSFKAPAGSADKGDPENEVKATVLMADGAVPIGQQVGCWATCHIDARTMPGADAKKTKYVSEGNYELMQWASKDDKVSDGSVSSERKMAGGKTGVKVDASKSADGYSVTFTRANPGEGKKIPMGFAIHADHASGRFHHVSLGYLLGIGTDADIKAVKQ